MNNRLSLAVSVPGIPESQGSAKAFAVAGKARITHSNKKLTSWRRDAIVALRDQMEAQEWQRVEECEVRLDFVFPRPKSHYGTGRNSQTLKPTAPYRKSSKPDIDKLCRGALDALMGAGLFGDDSCVTDLTSSKRYTMPGEGPHTFVQVVAWRDAVKVAA